MAKRSSIPVFLNLLFHLFKTMGVATMSSSPNFHFQTSRPGIAYNVLLTILVLIGTYFGVELAYFADFAQRIELEKIADTGHTLLLVCTALLVLLVQCVRQRDIVRLANDLRRAVEVSATLCRGKTHEAKTKVVVRAAKMIVLTNAATASFLLVTTPTGNGLGIFLYFVAVTICNFIVNTLVLQYTLVISLVTHLFDLLNSSLTEITSLNKIEGFEINFVQQKYGLQTKLGKLSQCREFFTSLSRLSREISRFMELIALACVSNAFVTLTMYSYYSLKPFIVESNVVPRSMVVRNVSQLCFSVVGLVLLAKAGSLAINQSKHTGEIVNECLHNEGFSCHPDVANQLNLFSNYLLHKNLRFGVGNLFTLDESLLMSIAGSISTYLVILLQFKESHP